MLPENLEGYLPYLDAAEGQVSRQFGEHADAGQVQAAVEVLCHLSVLLLPCMFMTAFAADA